MYFYIYDLTTGVITMTGEGPDGTAEANSPDGHGYEYAYADINLHRVDVTTTPHTLTSI